MSKRPAAQPATPALVQLDEDAFCDRFKPETDKHGDLYVQRDWTNERDRKLIGQAATERRLWTMVEGDDGKQLFFCSGDHWVNRLYYVICTVPHEPSIEYEVLCHTFEGVQLVMLSTTTTHPDMGTNWPMNLSVAHWLLVIEAAEAQSLRLYDEAATTLTDNGPAMDAQAYAIGQALTLLRIQMPRRSILDLKQETPEVKMLHSIAELAAYVEAREPTSEAISHRLYKDTSCGASAYIVTRPGRPTTVLVSSIVEGTEQTAEAAPLELPFTTKQWEEAVADVEAQAQAIWLETHACPDCGDEDVVNPACPSCKGQGAVR